MKNIYIFSNSKNTDLSKQNIQRKNIIKKTMNTQNIIFTILFLFAARFYFVRMQLMDVIWAFKRPPYDVKTLLVHIVNGGNT